jgi:hypothetical protein
MISAPAEIFCPAMIIIADYSAAVKVFSENFSDAENFPGQNAEGLSLY